MKFAPVKELDTNLKEPNRYYFSCFRDERFQRFTDTEFPHIEGFGSRTSQLKYIAAFLRSCFIDACLYDEETLVSIMQKKRRSILSGCCVSSANFFVRTACKITKRCLERIREGGAGRGGAVAETISVVSGAPRGEGDTVCCGVREDHALHIYGEETVCGPRGAARGFQRPCVFRPPLILQLLSHA